MYVALDKDTHDMFKNAGSGITRVTDGRFVVQQAQCKLRTILGEWVLDRSAGFLSVDYLGAQYDLYDIELRVIDVVSNIMHVKSIYDIEMVVEGRRTLTVNFKALTTFGIIDTKVPWV